MTKNSNDPVEQKSHTQKPGRQIFSGHRFSPKKTSAVYENTSPRSCLRWKPTGKIFTTVGLKWIPTGKMFTDSTTKVGSEPPNGSNEDITNPYECEETLNAPFLKEKKAPAYISSGLGYQLMTPRTISSGLYFNPSPSFAQPVLVAAVQEPIVSTGTPSSTRIDQDTPSTSTSQTIKEA
ncbi:hypothetical protein Tco_1534510 [Tanacetum coccineum]